MPVIDELHNVLGGRDNARREFLDVLRHLGNELQIPLAGVDTGGVSAIRSDDQLETGSPRCGRRRGKRATTRDPCWPASQLPSRCGDPPILTRSEGTVGELSLLLTEAAVAAVDYGEHPDDGRYTGRTEGRRRFEHKIAG